MSPSIAFVALLTHLLQAGAKDEWNYHGHQTWGSYRPAGYSGELFGPISAIRDSRYMEATFSSTAQWDIVCGHDCARCGRLGDTGGDQCMKCEDGFGFAGTAKDNLPVGKCLPCAEDCISCDGFLGGCSLYGCRSSNLGLQLKSPMWINSYASVKGWRAGSPACGSCGPHCAQCGELGSCYANGCEAGYGPVSPYTDPCAGSCGDRSQCWSSTCDVLDVLSQPPSATCEPCAKGCRSCIFAGAGSCDPAGCFELGYDYHAASGACVQCAEDCTVCGQRGPGKCDPGGCLHGLAANRLGSCQPCSDRCSKCEASGGLRCDEGNCDDGFGYDLDSSGCMRCSPNCGSCKASGAESCDIDGCAVGFEYEYGQCHSRAGEGGERSSSSHTIFYFVVICCCLAAAVFYKRRRGKTRRYEDDGQGSDTRCGFSEFGDESRELMQAAAD